MPRERWFGDYRSVGTVDWPEDLQHDLRTERRGLFRKMVLWPILTLPPLVGSIILNANSFLNSWSPQLSLLTWVALGLSLVLFAFGLMRCYLAWIRRQLIRRALRSPQLERFELAPGIIDDILLAHAQTADHPTADPLEGTPREVLIAPKPKLLVFVPDCPTSPLTPVTIQTVSKAQSLDTSVDGHTLPLTTEELRELRKHRRNCLMVLPISLVLVAVFVLALNYATKALTSSAPMSFRDWKAVIATGCFAIGLLYIFFVEVPSKLKRAKLVGKDITAGHCDLLDGETALDELSDAPLRTKISLDIPPTIVRRLPHSKLWWQLDDTPAPWRRFTD
ncbi:MAG: hypothetical protein ACF8MJ_01920 [Phycisphaerales bacterium JB050]